MSLLIDGTPGAALDEIARLRLFVNILRDAACEKASVCVYGAGGFKAGSC